jgi:hypothetical protein
VKLLVLWSLHHDDALNSARLVKLFDDGTGVIELRILGGHTLEFDWLSPLTSAFPPALPREDTHL